MDAVSLLLALQTVDDSMLEHQTSEACCSFGLFSGQHFIVELAAVSILPALQSWWVHAADHPTVQPSLSPIQKCLLPLPASKVMPMWSEINFLGRQQLNAPTNHLLYHLQCGVVTCCALLHHSHQAPYGWWVQ
jgi:hypothetical protein